jgi:hypothetical protein
MEQFDYACLEGFISEHWQDFIRYMDERFDDGEQAAEQLRAKLEQRAEQ